MTQPVPPLLAQPGPRLIQALLDEVVWYHGNNPQMWSSSVYQGLFARGLEIHHITKERLLVAQKHVDKVRDQRLRALQQQPHRPVDLSWPVATPVPDHQRRAHLVHHLKRQRELKIGAPSANNSTCGDAAGLASQPSEDTMTALQVRESEFRSALVGMGFDNADNPDKWDLRRLSRKVSSPEEFDSLVEAMKKSPAGADQDLVQNIADTLREGGSVEIVNDTDDILDDDENSETATAVHESNGHSDEPEVSQPSKKGKKKMTTATATAPKKKVKGDKPVAKKGKDKDKATRGPSLLDAAAQVLKASKKPLKVKDIFTKICEKGLWSERKGKTPEATLASAMYVEIKKKGDEARFEKVDRGEFKYKG